jgi:hypothetical protein
MGQAEDFADRLRPLMSERLGLTAERDCVAWLRRAVSWPGRAPVDARAWYRGIRPPPYADIISIADGLRVSHDWLATGRGEQGPVASVDRNADLDGQSSDASRTVHRQLEEARGRGEVH